MKTVSISLILMFRFVWGVLTSGLQTLFFILEYALGKEVPPAGIVEMRFPPLRLEGITLLAWMISLTPGTTVLHVNQEERIFRLHMLDVRSLEKTQKSIQHHFFPSVIALFGLEP